MGSITLANGIVINHHPDVEIPTDFLKAIGGENEYIEYKESKASQKYEQKVL